MNETSRGRSSDRPLFVCSCTCARTVFSRRASLISFLCRPSPCSFLSRDVHKTKGVAREGCNWFCISRLGCRWLHRNDGHGSRRRIQRFGSNQLLPRCRCDVRSVHLQLPATRRNHPVAVGGHSANAPSQHSGEDLARQRRARRQVAGGHHRSAHVGVDRCRYALSGVQATAQRGSARKGHRRHRRDALPARCCTGELRCGKSAARVGALPR